MRYAGFRALCSMREAQSEEFQQKLTRRGVMVRGVVQGVGFRPFIYRLAQEEHLAGFIGNDTDGVTIEIEGPSTSMDAFLLRLRAEATAAFAHRLRRYRDVAPNGETGFRIVASEVLGRVFDRDSR